jgi:hypothetical protein
MAIPPQPAAVTPPKAGVAEMRRRRDRRRRLFNAGLSIAGHVAIVAALVLARAEPPKPLEPQPEPMTVQLVDARPPAPEVTAPPAAAPPSPAKAPPPPRNIARRTPAHADVEPLYAGKGETDGTAELSDAQLASASAAGSGASGRPCDMAQRLQAALRKDPRVQAAVAEADRASGPGGKALFVWNGEWIRSRGQEGNGLAAVREAIMWEVAFAPEACRAEPVHGLVLFSLNDGGRSGRLVVGSGDWKWSDLLRPRGRG